MVDDEPLARRRLERQLAEIPLVREARQARDADDALEQLASFAADVLLLDIAMPGLDGISLAKRYGGLPPIIFTTAYAEHALEAFEVNAVDYLLKPIRKERLVEALTRVRESKGEQHQREIRALDALAGPVPGETHRIVSMDRGKTSFFEASEVTHFQSSQKYTLFWIDGEEHLTNEPLASLETRLADVGFVRVHRAELVRLDAVRALTGNPPSVELSDGQVARVSRRSLPELRRRLRSISSPFIDTAPASEE